MQPDWLKILDYDNFEWKRIIKLSDHAKQIGH